MGRGKLFTPNNHPALIFIYFPRASDFFIIKSKLDCIIFFKEQVCFISPEYCLNKFIFFIIEKAFTILLSCEIFPVTPRLFSVFSPDCDLVWSEWKNKHCSIAIIARDYLKDCGSIDTAKPRWKIFAAYSCFENHLFRRIIQVVYAGNRRVTILFKKNPC